MTESSQDRPRISQAAEMEKEARASSPGLAREFVDFLLYNKKWWLVPVLVVLALLGAFIILTQTAAAPFIYTLF